MKVKAIKCYCKSNPDLCGAWNADDVKEELKEICMSGHDWLDYLLDRIFSDCKEWTSAIQEVVVSDAVNEITLTLGSDKVTIKKFYGMCF